MLSRENSSIESDLNNDTSLDEIQRSTWQATKSYIYNSREGTCCNRTAKQWMMMVIYYILYTTFIVCLYLAFMIGCLAVVKYTNPEVPIVDKGSLLRTAHPGLGFVPNIVMTKYPLIWYSPDPIEERTEVDYIKALDKFFKKYKQADSKNYADCDRGEKQPKPCYFDLKRLGDCMSKGYQYTNSSLCFFLKLNRLKNWTPIYYKREIDFPDEMSQSMMDHILASSDKDIVHVECVGHSLWDNEHMGNVTYHPQQGFDGYFFPYKGNTDYLTPIVGIQLSNITTGVVIHITCTVWVKNIGKRLNHLHVKVFVDNTLPY